MKKRLKVNGFIIFCAYMLVLLFPRAFLRNQNSVFYNLDVAIGVLGIALILFGQLLRVSARGFKSQNSQNGSVLIQSGPYQLVRNPMYLGILLIGIGIVLFLFKWWAICIFLSVFIARYIRLIFVEEKKLLASFPRDYPGYQKNVPRLLPALNLLFKKDITVYLPLRFAWLEKEIGAIIAVLLVVFLLKLWANVGQGSLGHILQEFVFYIAVTILFLCLAVYQNKKTTFK